MNGELKNIIALPIGHFDGMKLLFVSLCPLTDDFAGSNVEVNQSHEGNQRSDSGVQTHVVNLQNWANFHAMNL